MISKSKYSLLLIVTLLVVTIFVASCEKETQEEFYTFDVGFETQGISRGIFLDAQDQVQLYFVRTNNDPKILFFTPQGKLQDSIVFNFPLLKPINNLHLYAKDTLINIVSQLNIVQFINEKGNIVSEKKLYDYINPKYHSEDILFIKPDFHNSIYKKNKDRSIYGISNFFTDDFFRRNSDFNHYLRENAKSYKALIISHLFDDSMVVELGLKGMFFDEKDPFRSVEVLDERIVAYNQDYFIFSAHAPFLYIYDDTLHLKKDIKLIDRSIHEGATQYIHDVLYDYRTEFVAVVLANIVPQSGRVDLKEEQIVSFDVSIYNGDWQKQQSFHFNAQEYSPYSIYLIQNNMYVENIKNATYGQVNYQLFSIL
ncbi:hypothetical protein HX045_16030 [Myroides odoratimimus]|uniref:hypothetical protein n=1 Tax=Myroides odoratimimus TaxID=76832 RepID=UPI0025768641|nr:hypothetical protein [Myroides odoratimimus]MDM1060216.1 hypothetical protein [Myroides odoratimimus]MDM1094878.1 hypothetical protein [Myroides odoratimimus]MDM1412393.1 hypothetical protein [Myroides odoratimimus]MDM1444964.1 hypothetical protein [Myroides odoratimimus]MDM1451542.1 hypothetical protein [Myroides odoratimimus]